MGKLHRGGVVCVALSVAGSILRLGGHHAAGILHSGFWDVGRDDAS